MYRWIFRAAFFAWAVLIGPMVGLWAGQRLMGADCQLSPTVRADAEQAIALAVRASGNVLRELLNTPIQKGFRMPTDTATLLAWLILPLCALAALAWWLRSRNRPTPAPEAPIPTEPPVSTRAAERAGREYKIAVGSAGIKSIVREGRLQDAYDVRAASETAFEAYADFDRQQERIAIENRLPGPAFLALSETLEARSHLSEGLGNRTPGDVWTMREEWMPALSRFVREAALQLRSMGIWPARITADLSAGGHGIPGLYALYESANEFPRADRHAHFIVPDGDVERAEALRLIDALRTGELSMGMYPASMPWKDALPLASTTTIRDNRQGREDLDEVAAHIAPALNARVRFETGTSENLSNLMRRVTKHGRYDDSEPCPVTFHYAESAVPLQRSADTVSVDLHMLMPLADATLRALRFGQGVTRALDVDIGRHMLIVTVPCSSWDDVRRVEGYVMDRLEFAGSPDRDSLGVFFSGYRPDPANREERIFAIRLGAVSGGWDAVYRSIHSTTQVIRLAPAARADGGARDGEIDRSDAAAYATEQRP